MKLLKSLRTFAAVAVTGVLVAGSVTLATNAHAVDIPDKQIVIHKHESPVVGTTAHNGKELNPAPTNPPIAGVKFKIREIDVPSGHAGYQLIKNLTPAQAATRLLPETPGNSQTITTNNQGIAISKLFLSGYYLVTEIEAPAHVATRSEPFIVTLPFPSDDPVTGQRTLLDTVHVYPKNAKSVTPTKNVNDAAAVKKDDIVTWTITQTVPNIPAGQRVENLAFYDTLDDRLEFVSARLKVNGVDKNLQFTQTPYNQGAIPPATAYSNDKITYFTDIKTVGTRLVTHANALTSGQVVTFEITTKVKAGGNIPNKGWTSWNTQQNWIETNTVHTNWGYLNVLKRSAGDNTPLKGAVFEIYKDNQCSAAQKVNIPASQLTTGTNGKFAAPVLLKAGTYFVKEATPPLGYVAPAQNCKSVNIQHTHTETAPASVTVDNEKTIVPNLPLTGSQGQLLLLIVGGGILAAGAITLVVLRIRRGY